MRFRRSDTATRIELVFDDGGMNLLSSAALDELHGQLGTDNGKRLLVFRSARPGLFAAGADMAEMRRFTALEAGEFARKGQELFAKIERLPLAAVALIDGDCFGGALDLAMAFDYRFATSRARFAHPGARIGIVTGFGGTSRWRKLMRPAAARRLFIGNEILSASDALALGLVDRVADDQEEALRALEEADPEMIRFVKELTIHSDRLTRSQRALLAQRLGNLYFGGSPWSR